MTPDSASPAALVQAGEVRQDERRNGDSLVVDPREEGGSPTVSVPAVAGAQVLVRALNLMFLLREEGGAVSTAELVSALKLPQANVYRLLQTLENAGLVDRDSPGRVRLGFGLLDLGTPVNSRIEEEIAPVSQAVMRSLSRELKQTSLLTMRAGLSAVCVQTVESPSPLRLSFTPGRLVPLLGGASGRVLLPWLPDRTLRHVLAQRSTWQLSTCLEVTIEELLASLLEVRKAGYLVTRGEVDPGITAVAAPVLMPDGRLWAGLSVAGPSAQFAEERLPSVIESVCRHAATLTANVASHNPA